MRVTLDGRDLATYPFLKESQRYAGDIGESLPVFLQSVAGKRASAVAVARIVSSLRKSVPDEALEPASDAFSVKIEIAGYALARILVSCAKDRQMMDRLARYEAGRAYLAILNEDLMKKEFLYVALGMDPSAAGIPLTQYIPLAAHLVEERWRLIHRVVIKGVVQVSAHERDELLRERIRVVIRAPLPLPVPADICRLLEKESKFIQDSIAEKMQEEFGAVMTSAYPPCIEAIMDALVAGKNLTHSGRFSVTTFLLKIGVPNERIMEMFDRSPDFDAVRTLYQVEHISGRGGTEYSAPSCAWMKTNSLCVRPDKICEKVQHPLSYYKIRKRRIPSGGPVKNPDDLPAHDTDNTDESNKREEISNPGAEYIGKKDEEYDQGQNANGTGDDIKEPGLHNVH